MIEYIDEAPSLEEYKEMRRRVNFMELSDRATRSTMRFTSQPSATTAEQSE